MTEAASVPIRDAATILLWRQTAAGPAILMGMRGAGAAFMPSKYVFPGGAADTADATVPVVAPLPASCRMRLADSVGPWSRPGVSEALAPCAVRELWEETGLVLGRAGDWPAPPPDDWRTFAETGHLPDSSALTFVFRAITPEGRPRRFDARFFLADAARLAGDPDDFSRASDELSHLHWVPIVEARHLNLPFITEVVLAEVADFVARGGGTPDGVPFFDNSGPVPTFRRL